jgi:hypothetical protein
MSADRPTYDKVGRKYDEWLEIQASKPIVAPVRSTRKSPPPDPAGSDMGRMVFASIGIGIGVVLLLLAALALWTAMKWSGFGRDGAAVGYYTVAFFLTVAGVGGIAATWNHNFRVLVRPPQQHH